MAKKSTKRHSVRTHALARALNVEVGEAARIAAEFNRDFEKRTEKEQADALLYDLRVAFDGDAGEGAEIAIDYAIKFGSKVRRVFVRYADVRVSDAAGSKLIDELNDLDCSEVEPRLCESDEDARRINEALAALSKAMRSAFYRPQGRKPVSLGF